MGLEKKYPKLKRPVWAGSASPTACLDFLLLKKHRQVLTENPVHAAPELLTQGTVWHCLPYNCLKKKIQEIPVKQGVKREPQK